MMTPFPLEHVIHGLGIAGLSFLTLLSMTGRSRLTPLLTIVTGLMAYWLFMILPVLMVGGALASLIVADLGILSYTVRRAGGWRGIRRAIRNGQLLAW